MVLVVSEQKLMIMRPYQVYAVHQIVEYIDDDSGNGYIWHTTGSGKTLTSFKASTLLKENDRIHKCVFVVDRKDLDRQTREEFNRFQEGCVEENINIGAMVRRLLSDDYADKVSRAPLVLYDLEEKSQAETAQLLGLTVEAVSSGVHAKQVFWKSGAKSQKRGLGSRGKSASVIGGSEDFKRLSAYLLI